MIIAFTADAKTCITLSFQIEFDQKKTSMNLLKYLAHWQTCQLEPEACPQDICQESSDHKKLQPKPAVSCCLLSAGA